MKFLLTVLSLSFLSLSGYGQSRDEIIEDFIEQRKKMMEQMIEMFHDDFNGDSFFQDDFDPFDSFSNMKSFSGVGSQIKIEEKYEEDGTISLIITPQKDNLSLDIKTCLKILFTCISKTSSL